MRKILYYISIVITSLAGCTSFSPDIPVHDEILFAVDGLGHVTAKTRTTELDLEVFETSGFYVTATTGSPGSESLVSGFSNIPFSKNGSLYTGGKIWPSSDPGYHFYGCCGATMSVSGGNCIVSANNTSDIVCAYLASPAFKTSNSLTFRHIFARLGTVTVSSAEGYTITGLSIMIVPKTSGTYNIRTGDGQTDGTGWSALTEGSEVNIGPSTPGSKSNDIYLVPGNYFLQASWTATLGGNYSESFSNIRYEISLSAGKVNDISVAFVGTTAQFDVTLSSWTTDTGPIERTFPATEF